MIRYEEIKNAIDLIYEQHARDVVRSLVRGNVLLHAGKYITADEIDRAFGPAPWRAKAGQSSSPAQASGSRKTESDHA